jgi:hypothetical protein
MPRVSNVNPHQLQPLERDLLLNRLAELKNNKAALARELGYARGSISSLLHGRYPANIAQVGVVIRERLACRIPCPHLARDIQPDECKWFRERPLSAASGSKSDVRHYSACRVCRFNPDAKVEVAS